MKLHSSARRPNIVIFMTDQQRGATVLAGDPLKARTPRLDRLRERGVTFSQCFTVSPHCCPSRTSFFTGRYPSEHGVWNNVNVANALSREPRADVPFWSRDLQAARYQLGFAGKWHLSNTRNPASYDWRECMVTACADSEPGASIESQRVRALLSDTQDLKDSADSSADHTRAEGEIVRPGYPRYIHYGTAEDPFRDAEVVASASEFIRDADHDQPWLLYVGTLGPHDPYIAPQRFLEQYALDDIQLPENFNDPMTDKPGLYRRTRERFDQLTEDEQRDALRHYLALCSYEDELFGRVEDAVESAGELDNTIFIYLSDHGDYAGDHGLWCKGLPSFESAVHFPLIIGGEPLDHRGTVVNTLTSIVDLAPTIMELCGLDAREFSGRSLVSDVDGRQTDPRREIFLQSNGNEAYGIQRTIVTDDWKLVMNYFDHDELYDRRTDPAELHNLLHGPSPERRLGIGPLDTIPEQLRPIVQDLYRRLWSFGLDHGDDLTNTYIMTALAPFGPMISHADPAGWSIS